MSATIRYVSSMDAVQVVSMRRSGTHAIIEWLAQERLGGTVLHANNLTADARWCSHVLIYQGRGTVTLKDSAALMIECDHLIESYEDIQAKHARRMPRACADRILIVRDAYNCIASRIKRGWPPRLATWCFHAREALGESNELGIREVILYNDWLEHQYPRVPPTAHGSSFDGTRHDGDVSSMDVRGRWRHYVGSREYHALFQDSEMRRLNEALFGDDPVVQEAMSAFRA